MTPAARIEAAIGLLDQVLSGTPAEAAALRWSRASRYAGSGDRAAVRDMLFEVLRQRDSLAALGGGLNGRGLMLGLLRSRGEDPSTIFTGQRHAPALLTEAERLAGTPPAEADKLPDMPDWLWAEWQGSLGPQALALAHAMRARAPVWLRVNPRRADPVTATTALHEAGIEIEPHPQHPHALRVLSGERQVARSAAYLGGMVELQDLSPQLACAALPVEAGQRVLDFCAGGGGKALAVAGHHDIELTAHDAAPARMADLPERARRAGVEVAITPPGQPGQNYDLVVADVPCSGSGTWRRTPDAKWRLTPAEFSGLRETQAQILDEAAALMRRGGRLAYMTCSLLQAENDTQITAFLERHPDFALEHRQSWTPQDASDGFFLALLRC